MRGNYANFSDLKLANRRVVFRFSGNEIRMDVSLGLFSSGGVDAGSQLLLKSLARKAGVAGGVAAGVAGVAGTQQSILDVGCGTGTLGLALAKKYPQSKVLMVDRDELAVFFSRYNSALNGLGNVSALSSLMFERASANGYDLIVSNVPAKAGECVIERFINDSEDYLKANGVLAMVLVDSIVPKCRDFIEGSSLEIIHEDRSSQHCVFHLRRGSFSRAVEAVEAVEFEKDEAIFERTENDTAKVEKAESKLLSPYIRNKRLFNLMGTRYEISGVWNLPDFDTLPRRIVLLGQILGQQFRKIPGAVLMFHEPGVGHLPVAVSRLAGADKYILCGRDRLALRAARQNLRASGLQAAVLSCCLADFRLASGNFVDSGDFSVSGNSGDFVDFLFTDLKVIPRSGWAPAFASRAGGIVCPGGFWALCGRSTDVTLLVSECRGWSPVMDKRKQGVRAVIFRRNIGVAGTVAEA